jgi:serine/threonine protein kinase
VLESGILENITKEYNVTVNKYDVGSRIVIEILKGLGLIHSHGIVHRDVKPSNIMLEKDTLKAKIADFGLALLLDFSQIEEVVQAVGTLSYMSPEQTGILKKPLGYVPQRVSLGDLIGHERCRHQGTEK